MQPYSPHLFRQGELPGPNILMKFLRRKISTEGAQKEWARVEAKKKTKSISKVEKKWLDIMPLPCRNCSNDEDQATWKPLSAFTGQYRQHKDVWKYLIARGQDLICVRCTSQAFARNCSQRGNSLAERNKHLQEKPNIQCDTCNG